MNSITVIIPTYNEEAYLKEAIQSVGFATQIIVIDSNSTDKTAEIAKQMGCEVYFRAFDNFSNQKNYALQYAKNDWILFLVAILIISSINYSILILIFDSEIKYSTLMSNSFITFLIYPMLAKVFNGIYLLSLRQENVE